MICVCFKDVFDFKITYATRVCSIKPQTGSNVDPSTINVGNSTLCGFVQCIISILQCLVEAAAQFLY